jgi:hypothetical protein
MVLYKQSGKDKYSYSDNKALTRPINESQLKTVIDVHNSNNSYNFFKHNCAYVACLAWDTAFNDNLNALQIINYAVYNPGTQSYQYHSVIAYTPLKLKKEIGDKNGAISDFDIGDVFD